VDLVLIVLAAALGTWVLRVALIGLVPADRLPDRLRRALDDVAPVILAAMVAGTLTAGGSTGASLRGAVAALVAATVAWRTTHLLATVGVGVTVYGLLGLLGLG
jgi:branched-subunit amino acid transport protein